jgi:hypothetical protein
MPHWVLTHWQEYMYFDLIIQTVNMLLLALITVNIIRMKSKIANGK